MGSKQCFVPSCTNNSRNNPDLLFVRILNRLRKDWCRQVNAEFTSSLQYCCESHLNRDDIKNYYKCKLLNEQPKMASNARLRRISSVEAHKRPLKPLLQHHIPSSTKTRKLDEKILPSTSASNLPFKMNGAMRDNMELADENTLSTNLYSVIKEEHEEVFDDSCVDKNEQFESTTTIIDNKSNDKISLETKQISDSCNSNSHVVSTYLDNELHISKLQVKEESEKMSDTVIELGEHGEQNKNLNPVKLESSFEYSCENNTNNFINATDVLFEATTTDIYSKDIEFIKNETSNIQERNGAKHTDMNGAMRDNMKLADSVIKEEHEEVFNGSCVEDISSSINIKNEPFESTTTIIDSRSNDKISLETKQISDTCNSNSHVVSTYLDDDQHISKLQVKEESEKMSDAVMELGEHGEQNKNLNPVKLEGSFEYSCENNTNNFINATDVLFEATTTDIYSKDIELIKNETSNIQERNGTKHTDLLVKDFKRCDNHFYIKHPDKNGDKLLDDEVALHVSDKSTFHRTHTGDKPFNCKSCHRSFSRRIYLKRHLRTHIGGNSFYCEICHKLFSRRRNWSSHLRTHTEKKLFNCHVCSKSFFSSGYLKIHLRTHTEEKPFQCEVCHKSFSVNVNLKSSQNRYKRKAI